LIFRIYSNLVQSGHRVIDFRVGSGEVVLKV